MANREAATVDIEYHPGGVQLQDLEVAVGTRIRVTLHGSAAYGWEPVHADGSAVTVLQAEAVDGTSRALAVAVQAGEAELRATSSHVGDRFGPQTRLWRLRVTVVASS
jgi:hypothetical protein